MRCPYYPLSVERPHRAAVRRFAMHLPKTITEIRSLARAQTRTALNVLVGVMRNKGATPARVFAANAILDLGWGKATQPLQNGDEGALELIHRIEREAVLQVIFNRFVMG